MPELGNYRVEVSSTNRAGCKDSKCQETKVKILKGELRFGTWVTIHEHGSWSWRHWGCVSGQTLGHLREVVHQNSDGTYDVEALDGFDEMSDHPDFQDKIRRCVNQGFIDPEDFKGDPEFNVLGKRGIRGRTPKKKANANPPDDEDDGDGARASAQDTPSKKPGKRSRKSKAADDDDGESEPPAKKSKKAKVAAAKAIKDEGGSDLESAPVTKKSKKAKGAAVKDIKDGSGSDLEPAPVTKKIKARKSDTAVKDEVKDEPLDDIQLAPAKTKKGRKLATVKDEGDEKEEEKKVKKAKKAKKAGPAKEEADEQDEVDVPAQKTSRVKSKAAESGGDEAPADARQKGGRKASAAKSKK